MTNPALIDDLTAALGPGAVLSGAAISSRYECDWTGLHPQRPELVLLPGDTGQVSTILECCQAAGQAIVVQGGMTGLAGGATPQRGEIALSLERLAGIGELDVEGMTITVGAGTPLQVIQDAAAEHGLTFPLDLGARGSCQIGGNVSTNAGGNQVIRYGMTRSLVLGLEAVLADGTVISAMNELLKNNAGMDLKHLFIGSEGLLGVVTRLVLRLYPLPKSVNTVLVTLPEPAAAITLLGMARRTFAESLNSFEVMWPNYYQTVLQSFPTLRDPFDQPYGAYALIEVRGNGQDSDAALLESMLGEALEQGLVSDASIATSLSQAAEFWAIRDSAGELIPKMGNAAVFDIGVPIRSMVAFVDAVEAQMDRDEPRPRSVCFGHIGDGNLHYMVECRDAAHRAEVEKMVYTQTGLVSGSVSAEHGIGTHKKDYLGESRSRAEIELMQRLKRALDPAGILNPGRMIEP